VLQASCCRVFDARGGLSPAIRAQAKRWHSEPPDGHPSKRLTPSSAAVL